MSDRATVLTQIRLHQVLSAIAHAHYGDAAPTSTLQGDGGRGRFALSDGQGAQCWAAWNEDGIVVLVFDDMVDGRQRKVPAADRDLGHVWVAVPPELAELVAAVSEESERLGTASLWVTANGRCDVTGDADILELFQVGPEEALDQGLGEFFSVSAEQGALAADIARRAGSGPVVLTSGEMETLREEPSDTADFSEKQFKRSLKMLEVLSVSAPGARKR